MKDELNVLGQQRNIEPIEQYFSKMDISEEEKQNRVDMAKDLNDILLFILALILLQKEQGNIDRANIITQFFMRVKHLVGIDVIDTYLETLIINTVSEIVDTTISNINDADIIEISNDNWWVSQDRALFIAEDTSNSINNYRDYVNAVKNGFKYKVWKSYKDNKVRKTHRAVDGAKKPIKEPFVVGNSLMLFPKDTSYNADAKEIINCRCTLKYTRG